MGKRPDQYQIDPAEAGATDYKNLPQTGLGNSDLDDTIELDRQQLTQQSEGGESVPAPGAKPAPSADTRRGTKQEQEQDQGGEESAS